MRWSTARKRQLHVKVRPLRLEAAGAGFSSLEGGGGGGGERVVVLKMKWKGPRSGSSGLVLLRRVASTCQRNYTSHKLLRAGSYVEWDQEEFNNVCDFWVSSNNSKEIKRRESSNSSLALAPWDVTFQVQCGEDNIGDSRTRLAVLGDVSLDLAELASQSDEHVEKRLPVSLRIDGVYGEATLLIRVSFAEVRASYDFQQRTGQNLGDAKVSEPKGEASSGDDQPAQRSSDLKMSRSPDGGESVSSEGGTTSSSKEYYFGSKVGFSSWTRRLTSFKYPKRKREQAVDEKQGDNGGSSSWEVKVLTSRDGKATVKADVFLASFDQRAEIVGGESACSALVVVIAHWLHSNREFMPARSHRDLMPTRSQFDSLITDGSSEWRRLCNHEAYANCFPDNHFDLETIMRADLRPVTTVPERSYTAIFSPEKFECLKEAMSFDKAWDEINRVDQDYDQGIYIVSWNDHFFVLKVEADACYLIDSLGERLYEGCNQAYILKFDESSLMYEEVGRYDQGPNETAGREKGQNEIVCKGKDCCREFIKRFFAAIPVSELEEQEKKGTVSAYSLLQRLQIDLHYCSSSASSSSSSPIFSPDYSD